MAGLKEQSVGIKFHLISGKTAAENVRCLERLLKKNL
jgi:hypothetical protein